MNLITCVSTGRNEFYVVRLTLTPFAMLAQRPDFEYLGRLGRVHRAL